MRPPVPRADWPGGKPRVHRQVTLLPKHLVRHARRVRERMKQLQLPGLNDDAPVEPPPYWRPKTRGDCVNGPRPCPFVACRYNLMADISPAGSLKLPFGDSVEAFTEVTHTCALDAAEAGGMTLEQVAVLTNLTRERVRQVERMAASRMRRNMGYAAGDDDEDLRPVDEDD